MLLLATAHLDEDNPIDHETDPLAQSKGTKQITRGSQGWGEHDHRLARIRGAVNITHGREDTCRTN